jgi:hypothetical protein
VLIAVGATTASLVLPGWRSVFAGAAALLVFTAIAGRLLAELTALRVLRPGPFDEALERPARSPERPPDLVRLERTLSWRVYSRRDFDHRVRPVLKRLVDYKLRSGHGIALERQPELAREKLPGGLRTLIDEPRAGEFEGGVVDTDTVARLVDEIERL